MTAATIASWMKRVDEQGADALVQIREPVNKFPHFVRYAVQRLNSPVHKPCSGLRLAGRWRGMAFTAFHGRRAAGRYGAARRN